MNPKRSGSISSFSLESVELRDFSLQDFIFSVVINHEFEALDSESSEF